MQHPVNESGEVCSGKGGYKHFACIFLNALKPPKKALSKIRGYCFWCDNRQPHHVQLFLFSSTPNQSHPGSLNGMASLPKGYGRHTSLLHGYSHSRAYHTKTLILEAWRYKGSWEQSTVRCFVTPTPQITDFHSRDENTLHVLQSLIISLATPWFIQVCR